MTGGWAGVPGAASYFYTQQFRGFLFDRQKAVGRQQSSLIFYFSNIADRQTRQECKLPNQLCFQRLVILWFTSRQSCLTQILSSDLLLFFSSCFILPLTIKFGKFSLTEHFTHWHGCLYLSLWSSSKRRKHHLFFSPTLCGLHYFADPRQMPQLDNLFQRLKWKF